MSNTSRHLPALLLAAGVALAAPGCAAGFYEEGYPRAGYPPPPPRAAYVSVAARNGYLDGIEAGRRDARHHERFDPVRARRFGAGGYANDRRYGGRDEYTREYRAAFERGYAEGYDRRQRNW